MESLEGSYEISQPLLTLGKAICLFRSSIAATVLMACQTCAAHAQQHQLLESYIADMWQVFVSRCGLLIDDPQAFLSTLPPTNTRGGPNAVTTSDRALLISSTSQKGFTVDADIIAQSNGMNVSCHVFPSTKRFLELSDFTVTEIELALGKFLMSQGLRKPSGGEVKNAFTGPQDGDELEYHYAIEISLSGITTLTRFEMIENDLAVLIAGVIVPTGN